MITGQPGVGKTAAARHVLREMEEKGLDETTYLIYINCWKKDTAYKAILEICNILGYKYTHDKSTDQLLKEVARIINKKSAVFVFDEIDKLDESNLLYFLLDDILKKTIIMITNEQEFLSSIDKRISSRLSAETMEFKPYNLEETRNILKQRISYAFVKSCWQQDAIEKIVEKTLLLKDIRQGLFLLRESAMVAESLSSRSITIEHASKAISKLPGLKQEKKELDEDSSFILNLVKENSGRPSRDIYLIYKKSSDKSFRTFQRKIRELSDINLVTIENKFINGTPTAILNYSGQARMSDYYGNKDNNA